MDGWWLEMLNSGHSGAVDSLGDQMMDTFHSH